MEKVKPKIYLIGETKINYDQLEEYLMDIGAVNYFNDLEKYECSDIELLSEIYGRLCYKSFEPGMNPNVTKVRKGNEDYISNIIKSKHGSVFEHCNLNFIFSNVSRVFTHELIRHRSGVAISQESLRYVRLNKIDGYIPVCIEENEEALKLFVNTMELLEDTQNKLSKIFNIDEENNFHVKKELTSAFRRIAPIGLSTTVGWSCNIRTLRHIIESRTDPSSEEEIRYVFGNVFNIVNKRFPNLFSDYTSEISNGLSHIKTENRKI